MSVLLATYNGRKYLAEAIESIVNQQFRGFEFLLIDDGSTDGSLAVMQRYAAADPRIRLISWANRGLTPSLNEGIRLARAPLIARMDADDVALPTRLEKQVQFLSDHPEVALVGSQVILIDPAGRPIGAKHGLPLDHAAIDGALVNVGWPLVHPAVMFRRDAVLALGGYCDEFRVNQDHDLFLRIGERHHLANLPDTLLLYRQHFESVSLAKSQLQAKTLERIMTLAYERRGMADRTPPQASRAAPKRPVDYHRAWVWAALSAGNVATARRHAAVLCRRHPLDPQSWRALYAALRGR